MDKPMDVPNYPSGPAGQLAQTLNATLAAAKEKIANLNAARAAKNLKDARANIQPQTNPGHGGSKQRS